MVTVQGHLEQVRAKRAALEARFAVLQAELAGVRAEERSLLQRLAGPTPEGERPLARTDRVRGILEQAEGPLSPSELVVALAQGGHQASAADVRGTLAHLKREGHATTVGRAQWVAVSS